MKVLWFTNTPSLASKHYGHTQAGGGWISSLEEAITNDTNIELAVAFFTNSKKGNYIGDKSTYYPIYRKENILQKLVNRHFNLLHEYKYLKKYFEIIDDFKPDIIQIFGTENGFIRLCGNTTLPACIHIQGVLSDCRHYFFPRGITKWDLFKYSPLRNILMGTSLLHTYCNIEKRAKRELNLLPTCHYYLGRTSYDKSFVENNAAGTVYFHCNEILRKEFYETKEWTQPQNEKIIVLTVNNGEIYKGIDIILETADILKKHKINFEWCIAGIDQSNTVLRLFENKLKLAHKKLNINLLGKLNTNEIINQMMKSNLFIHASRIDNSPNSVCEAMLVGMPVMTFNVGGISSLLNNDCGILIDRVESSSLAEEIINASSNTNYLSKIGKSARLVAQKRHDLENIINSISSVYEEIIQNK